MAPQVVICYTSSGLALTTNLETKIFMKSYATSGLAKQFTKKLVIDVQYVWLPTTS